MKKTTAICHCYCLKSGSMVFASTCTLVNTNSSITQYSSPAASMTLWLRNDAMARQLSAFGLKSTFACKSRCKLQQGIPSEFSGCCTCSDAEVKGPRHRNRRTPLGMNCASAWWQLARLRVAPVPCAPGGSRRKMNTSTGME